MASLNEHEALIGCNQLGKEESGSSLPLSGTLGLPSLAELTHPCSRALQVAWTSGSLFAEPNKTPLAPGQSRKFHVAVTSNDSRYVQWQMRVMYYWYKKRKVCV